MARIIHPFPRPGRVKDRVSTADGPVIFTDGETEIDLSDKPVLEAYYRQHGYGIEEAVAPVDEAVDEAPAKPRKKA